MEEQNYKLLQSQRELLQLLNAYPWKKDDNNEFQDIRFEAFQEVTYGQTYANNKLKYYAVFQSQIHNGLFPFIQSVMVNEILELLALSANEGSQQSAIMNEIHSLSLKRSEEKDYNLGQCKILTREGCLIKQIFNNFYWFQGVFMPKVIAQKEEQLKGIEEILTQKWLIYQQSYQQGDIFEWTQYASSLRQNTPFILVQTSSSSQPSQIRQFIKHQKTEQVTEKVIASVSPQAIPTKGLSFVQNSPLNQDTNLKGINDLESQQQDNRFQIDKPSTLIEINDISHQNWNQKHNQDSHSDHINLINDHQSSEFSNLSINQQRNVEKNDKDRREQALNNYLQKENQNLKFFNFRSIGYCENQNVQDLVKQQQLDSAQNYQVEGYYRNDSRNYNVEQQETTINQGKEEGKAQNELDNNLRIEDKEKDINLKNSESEQDNEWSILTYQEQKQDANSLFQQLDKNNKEWKIKLENKEKELLKMKSEREEDVEKLKRQLSNQKDESQKEVEELRKEITQLKDKLKETIYYYEQNKEKLADKVKSFVESQENLENQKILTNATREIVKNTIKELEIMKEEKKMIEERLQKKIEDTEAKWKNWWGEQLNQHQKTNQALEGAISQQKIQIESIEKENLNLKQTNLSLKETMTQYDQSLKEKEDQICFLKETNKTMNNQYTKWCNCTNEIIQNKDYEIQSLTNIKQEYQEKNGKLICQINQLKFNAKETVLAPYREAIRACSECNQQVPSIGYFNGKNLCLSCYQDYLQELY